MSQSSAIMDKLAWRAKWRKRWHKWKTIIVATLLLLILVPSFLCFTPWAPRKVYEGILATKIDPKTKKLRPESVESLYKMGMFYSITMREDEARECWDKLTEWYYGYSISRWASDSLRKKEYRNRKKNRLKFPKKSICWVGYAMYRLGESRNLHKHKQQAKKIYEKYLKDFNRKPGEDKQFTTRVQIFLQMYGAGG